MRKQQQALECERNELWCNLQVNKEMIMNKQVRQIRDVRNGKGDQRRRLHRRAPRRRRHRPLLWRCRRLSVSDLRCGGQQREGEVDRLFQRAECVLRRGRLCAHPRRGDAGDDLWRRRAVGHQRRDGRQGRTIAGLSRRRHAVLSAPARAQDHPSHARRWRVRQFRRPVRRCRMLSCGDHPRQLRRRNGARHRRGPPRQSAGLHRGAFGLCSVAGGAG